MWDTFLSLISSWTELSSNTTPRLLALLAVVVSLALPILKSLKSGRVRYIEKISTISVWSWLVSFSSFLYTKMILAGIVVIFAKGKNRQERIWETYWFNGIIIYRTLLENVLVLSFWVWSASTCLLLLSSPFLAALDNKFITKKRLKLHSNLLIKTFLNFAWKTAILVDNYSQCKDLFKPPSWKAIWDRVRVWTHLPWIFLLDHLVDLFLSLISIMIIFFFSFTCLSCDVPQNNGKKQGIDIF